jgi:hypothetical protein
MRIDHVVYEVNGKLKMEDGKLKKGERSCPLAPCGRGMNFGARNECQKFRVRGNNFPFSIFNFPLLYTCLMLMLYLQYKILF